MATTRNPQRYVAEYWPTSYGVWAVTDTKRAKILFFVATISDAQFWADDFNRQDQQINSVLGVLQCLYCGNADDIEEIPVTIDERTTEYALQCGHCYGVWAE